MHINFRPSLRKHRAATVKTKTTSRGFFGAFGILIMAITMMLSPLQIQSSPSPISNISTHISIAYAVDGSTGQRIQKPATNSNEMGCGLSSGFDMCISGMIYIISVAIPAYLLYIGSVFLGLAVKISLTSTTYAMAFVSTGWTVSRDVANMAFLFVLIYLAFTIMLRAESAHTMQTLAWIIVIALVVNFSFFATRAVIDTGNIVAVEIYNAIPVSSAAAPAPGGDSVSSVLAKVGVKDLSASIMGALNIQGLLDTEGFRKWNNSSDNASWFSTTRLITLSCIYITMGVLMVILAMAFLTAGVQFLMRIVVLWFLIIASPLAFVCWALPFHSTEALFGQWRDSLIKNTFYPAIFLFIFLFLTVFMRALSAGNPDGALAAVFSQLAGSASAQDSFIYTLGTAVAQMLIELTFVILMIKLALDKAESLGGEGAKFAKSASGWVGGRYFSTVGSAGRNTIGWAGYGLGNSMWAKEAAEKGPARRALVSTLKGIGSASFDYRGAAGAGSVLSGTGQAQKGGYAKDLKDSIDKVKHTAHEMELTGVQKEKVKKTLETGKYANEIAQRTAEKEAGGAAQEQLTDLEIAEREAVQAQKDAAEKLGAAAAKLSTMSPSDPGHAAASTEHERLGRMNEEFTSKARIAKEQADQARKKIELAKSADEALKNIDKNIGKEVAAQSHHLATGYAEGLTRINPQNLFGIMNTANKEALAQLRSKKGAGDRLLDIVKEQVKEEAETKHEDTHKESGHAPAAAAPAAAAHTPQGDDHGGGHGGGAHH